MEFLDGGEQGRDLEPIAADLAGRGRRDASGDGVFDGAYDEFGAELRGAPIAEFVQLGKMVPRVDVEQRQREFGRAKGFFSEPQ